MDRFRIRPNALPGAVALGIALVMGAPGAASAGEGHVDFATAQEQAAERDVPIVVDFFTDWCVYCKHFDRDLADASSGIANALEAVVFTSIDAEKGAGIELAKRYQVTGFPSYVMVDAEGELIDKWSGYGGPDHFLTAFGDAMQDTRTHAEKVEAFAQDPTAPLAEKFGEMALSNGEYDEAIELFRRASELDPKIDQSSNVLDALFGKLRRGVEGYDLDTFAADARALVLEGHAAPEVLVTAAQMVGFMARRADRPEIEMPFLEAALAAVDANPDAFDERTRDAIRISGYLRVTNEPEKAVAAKKASLPDGWREDADQLNSFAWWCFENDVNLEEARTLAVEGVRLASTGKQRAMILDTVAEICNAMGDCGEALAYIERALEEEPDNEHYREQYERFAQRVQEQGAGTDR